MTTKPMACGAIAARAAAQRGITLIEMVIVLAILGIVASLVYPSYLDRSRQARRVDAKSALMNIAGEQERFFLRNNRYATSTNELGITRTENELYDLALTSASDSEFVATATPATGKGQDLDVDCAAFTIDHLGRKLATGGTPVGNTSAECWR